MRQGEVEGCHFEDEEVDLEADEATFVPKIVAHGWGCADLYSALSRDGGPVLPLALHGNCFDSLW